MSINAFWQSLKNEEKTICQYPVYKMVEVINQMLHKVTSNLYIDITAGKNKPFCLMISAQDNLDYFAEVIDLYHHAPSLSHFEVVAFRQPTSLDRLQIAIEDQHLTLTNQDILVTAHPEHRRIALTLFIVKELPIAMQESAKALTIMLVSHALGEYEFATRINHIQFVATQQDQQAISLTDFTQTFEALWQNTLQHDGQYPSKANWQWVDLEIPYQHDEVTDTALVARNESANALVADIHYCYRLELAARVDNKQTMNAVFELETQINNQLLTTEDVIYCQTVYSEAVRYMSWYVKHPQQAFQQAEAIRHQFKQLDTELIIEFDPTWSDYLRWVEE